MEIAHFNIGSNLGHRLANISKAVALLSARLGQPLAVSAPVESAPWGFDSPNGFLNVGVSFATDATPAALLVAALAVEREIAPGGSHRTASGVYADRVIDVDLICVGDVVSDSDPILPHPRMHLRGFVLRPLAEMHPSWIHPRLGLTSGQLLALIDNKSADTHVNNSKNPD
ncbi:MAG: 2-amino-4-hydroxy-6-hydroxymethyldihydropteridine diphosphokinase [Muribaculaceae bacterium]|nr:2-amino-4-hydroxy-6-hydroxymethyldihydropteridine diphosphokinase [Muribaculaceae bacterium]